MGDVGAFVIWIDRIKKGRSKTPKMFVPPDHLI
jgi:hypothetical protein